MTDERGQHHHDPEDLLVRTKTQLAAVTAEFQKRVGAVNDPARRRELTISYIELMQRYLGKAQQSLDRLKPQQRDAAGAPSEAAGSRDDAGTSPTL